MRIYLDCEFNGFGGELISMAMVTEEGHEWYAMRHLPGIVDPWVAKHVIPKLGDVKSSHDAAFHHRFEEFITQYPDCEIIADWPADFEHFNACMSMVGKIHDFTIPMEYTMRFLKGSPDIKPEDPHNALSDARALRDWHQSTLVGA